MQSPKIVRERFMRTLLVVDTFAGQRIGRLPAVLRPIALLVKNLKEGGIKKRVGYWGRGIATFHNVGFLEDPSFERCYQRTIEAYNAESLDPIAHFQVHQAIWCASIASRLPGDFVECGTGRGMMMSAVLESIQNWNQGQRRMFLIDTFSPFAIDKDTGEQLSTSSSPTTYAKDFESTRKQFSPWKNVEFVVGKIPEVLRDFPNTPISFLHIDLNNALPEIAALEFFWPMIVPGGVILLDDYAWSGAEKQYEAMNELGRTLGFCILTTASGQGIVIKA